MKISIGTDATCDSEKEALRPLPALSTEDAIIVETNLTADEKLLSVKAAKNTSKAALSRWT